MTHIRAALTWLRRGVVRPPADPRWPGKRGAALLVVLLFSALLAGLAVAATRGAMSGARAAAVFLDAMRADDLGRSAADAVAYQIASGGPDGKRGGAFTIHLAEADMDVDYRSESARVDVNTAPVELIAALLGAAGAEPDVVAAAAARIAAFRGTPAAPQPPGQPAGGPAGLGFGTSGAQQGGDAAVSAAVARPGSQQQGPARQIQSTAEVAGAWGLPDGLARRVIPDLTVANGSKTIDPILADRLVLSALLGDDARTDDYVERRRNGFADSDSALVLLPVTAKAFAGFTDVSAVRVLARVTVAHRFVRRYELVIDPPAFPGSAPKVLSWQPLF